MISQLPFIANYDKMILVTIVGHLLVKPGLDVYQVIWYRRKSIVQGVKHVLSVCMFRR